MKTEKGIRYAQGGECLMDLYEPEGAKGVFLYFHGGGLEAGGRADAGVFAEMLAGAGYALASADYRMYPSARYPQFIQDAAQAAVYVKSRFPLLPLYAGGSSAGAYLSMMLCFDDKYLKEAGGSADTVAGYVHDAGQPTAHFNVLRERGLDPRRVIVDESAPLWHVGTKEKYPPMYFVWSDGDMENRPEQTRLLLSTMKHFGLVKNVFTKEMRGGHCAYVGRIDGDGKSAMGKILLEALEALSAPGAQGA